MSPSPARRVEPKEPQRPERSGCGHESGETESAKIARFSSLRPFVDKSGEYRRPADNQTVNRHD
jgi:hypothetical protein